MAASLEFDVALEATPDALERAEVASPVLGAVVARLGTASVTGRSDGTDLGLVIQRGDQPATEVRWVAGTDLYVRFGSRPAAASDDLDRLFSGIAADESQPTLAAAVAAGQRGDWTGVSGLGGIATDPRVHQMLTDVGFEVDGLAAALSRVGALLDDVGTLVRDFAVVSEVAREGDTRSFDLRIGVHELIRASVAAANEASPGLVDDERLASSLDALPEQLDGLIIETRGGTIDRVTVDLGQILAASDVVEGLESGELLVDVALTSDGGEFDVVAPPNATTMTVVDFAGLSLVLMYADVLAGDLFGGFASGGQPDLG